MFLCKMYFALKQGCFCGILRLSEVDPGAQNDENRVPKTLQHTCVPTDTPTQNFTYMHANTAILQYTHTHTSAVCLIRLIVTNGNSYFMLF